MKKKTKEEKQHPFPKKRKLRILAVNESGEAHTDAILIGRITLRFGYLKATEVGLSLIGDTLVMVFKKGNTDGISQP